jgi:hypothetical protein
MGKWIGIAGVKYSGKDTLAQYFVDRSFIKVNFADNLKSMLAFAFGLDLNLFYDSVLKEELFEQPMVLTENILNNLNGWITKTHQFSLSTDFVNKELKNPREIMQFVGTDMIRKTYNDYHVEATIKMMEPHEYVVCSDIRFPNELVYMSEGAKELGHKFTSIYIERPGFSGDSHSSENSISQSDMAVHILNDTTIENLHKIAKLFV